MSGPFFPLPPVLSLKEAREAAERELAVWTETGAGTPVIVHSGSGPCDCSACSPEES